MTEGFSQQASAAGDQPLEDLSEDELGRKGFVESLRDEVRDAPADGFVIGVTGGWGSGKTSVINMALNPLQDEKGFRVVPFNPWLFSGTPQLVEHFFTEVSSQLCEAGAKRKGEQLTKIGDAIATYADIIDPLRFAPGVGTAAQAARASAGLLRRAGRAPKSAAETKDVLDKLLREHDERLVIVVDDIDRLTDDEIREVMRLVRLVGGFPNTVYVLAYAPDTVARALGGTGNEAGGHEYLEKIVQLTQEVPAIDPEQLSELLLARINRAIAGISYEATTEHWPSIYGAMRPFFRTLRDVLRYANAIRSPAKHLADELDLADLLGLEAMRLFELTVWQRIDELADTLTRPGDQYLSDRDRGVADEQIRGLVEAATRPDQVRPLLQGLFPATERVLGRSSFGSDFMRGWRRKGRVAHIENLRVYLGRQVNSMGASRALTNEVMQALSDPDRARALFAQVEDERLPALLSRLADYDDELSIEAAASIPVLYELAPRLPGRGPGFAAVDPSVRIGAVSYRIVNGTSPERVAEALEGVIVQVPLLSDRISLLRTMGWRSEEDLLATEAALKRLGEAVVGEAVRRPAGELADEPDLASLSYYTREVRGDDAAREWARARIDEPLFALRLLTTDYGEVRNAFGRHLQLAWDRLVDLLGEERLVDVIKQLPQDDEWPRALSDDETELMGQARIYADDPAEARRQIEEYRRRYA